MIYLDNAATTYPKPASVVAAVTRAMTEAGGNPGRSGHTLSMRAGEEVYACREAVASLYGARAEQVVFTQNATQALNLSIRALAREGGHILISDLEHNAVRRPVAALGRERGGSWGIFPTGQGDPEQVRREIVRRLRRNTCLVVCTQASNLTSHRPPVAAIGALCRERGIPFVVDASQSAGSCSADLDALGADALCAPGHKGLYGPMGCGFALFSRRYLEEGGERLRPLLYGGSGVDSRPERMPSLLPERLEAGTLPVCAIAGLRAGVEMVRTLGQDQIHAHACGLFHRMRQGLEEIGGVTVYRPDEAGGVLLFSVRDRESEQIAAELDARGICVRAGLHCAPLAHRTLGTPPDGAVRISFSVYSTEEEVEEALAALRDVIG